MLEIAICRESEEVDSAGVSDPHACAVNASYYVKQNNLT